MRKPLHLIDPEVMLAWLKPRECDVAEATRPRYLNACAALTSVLSGDLPLTRAANDNRICPKRLRAMAERAPLIAPDGVPYGYRVCVPWGAYHRETVVGMTGEAAMPGKGGPHAMRQFLTAQPEIAGWVEGYTTPLPPGRPPKTFDRLHRKIVAELKRLDLKEYYPLNEKDEGRQALLRYIRSRRITLGSMGGLEGDAPPEHFDDVFVGPVFSRTEFDGHRIDIEAVVSLDAPGGGVARKAITTMWLLVEIERRSRAVVGWVLRIGRAYNSHDVADCIARSLIPWSRRELSVPGLEYAPGSGMPSGMLDTPGWRTRSIALDNALAHYANQLEEAFCRAHGGRLIFGRAHEPRSRPIVEQFFSRLERGALRQLPGGFEPAKRLGDNKIRISNFATGAHPIQLHAFEELLDVIISNYNATPHPALGNLTPLQFLQTQPQRAFDFVPDSAEDDARDMGSYLVTLIVHGNRRDGVLPHVNFMYCKYRSGDLDQKWELVGKKVLARVCRSDLRTLVLMRSATTPLCVVRATSPWNKVPHDITTRAQIMQWSKLRAGFSVVGVDCAITAFVAYLKQAANESPVAVDQLARMHQQLGPVTFGHEKAAPSLATPFRVPSSGWVSLDDDADF